MSNELWCGKPCADCLDPCRLDESISCRPDCDLLNRDATVDILRCRGCDAIDYNEQDGDKNV